MKRARNAEPTHLGDVPASRRGFEIARLHEERRRREEERAKREEAEQLAWITGRGPRPNPK